MNPAIMPPDMASWADMAKMVDDLSIEVHVALVGKYTDLQDSYLSVLKALKHGAFACRRKLIIDWVEASDLELDENISTREINFSFLMLIVRHHNHTGNLQCQILRMTFPVFI